jgi:hypothetical protein
MRRAAADRERDPFRIVREVGLTLPHVEATVRYDGAPVLKVGGCFMAGLASHPSAEPQSLVVRYALDDRDWLIDDAPDIYYLTDYYRPYPLILARLSKLDQEALRDLLKVSWCLTAAKSRLPVPPSPRSRGSFGL